MLRRGKPCVLALAAAAIAGCGASTTPSRPAPGEPSRDAAVIRAWADALRHGDVDAAASRFAVPSVVSNGTPPISLRSRAAVRAFNRSLPCGARLVASQTAGRYTTATFVLTERPDGDCGTGTGERAKTTFRIARGKIVEWRRAPEGTSPPPGSKAV